MNKIKVRSTSTLFLRKDGVFLSAAPALLLLGADGNVTACFLKMVT
jgi:hypothetical protein